MFLSEGSDPFSSGGLYFEALVGEDVGVRSWGDSDILWGGQVPDVFGKGVRSVIAFDNCWTWVRGACLVRVYMMDGCSEGWGSEEFYGFEVREGRVEGPASGLGCLHGSPGAERPSDGISM